LTKCYLWPTYNSLTFSTKSTAPRYSTLDRHLGLLNYVQPSAVRGIFKYTLAANPAPVKYFFLSKYFLNTSPCSPASKAPYSSSLSLHPKQPRTDYKPQTFSSFFINRTAREYRINPKLGSGFVSNPNLNPLVTSLKNFKWLFLYNVSSSNSTKALLENPMLLKSSTSVSFLKTRLLLGSQPSNSFLTKRVSNFNSGGHLLTNSPQPDPNSICLFKAHNLLLHIPVISKYSIKSYTGQVTSPNTTYLLKSGSTTKPVTCFLILRGYEDYRFSYLLYT
jgi:hypothetical protein